MISIGDTFAETEGLDSFAEMPDLADGPPKYILLKTPQEFIPMTPFQWAHIDEFGKMVGLGNSL